ncbi:MAG TPA: hypothetical protein DFS52_22910, partial [Myxococcales bacterium]|nr:hypothetical protein [Myxococcales bacterium]
ASRAFAFEAAGSATCLSDRVEAAVAGSLPAAGGFSHAASEKPCAAGTFFGESAQAGSEPGVAAGAGGAAP